MKTYKYIIVGGGMAGGKACEGIRQIDNQGSIVLITQEPHRPYEKPPLSKKFLQGEVSLEHVFLDDTDFFKQNNIELIQGIKVIEISPDQGSILLEDQRKMGYEKLLLATGGRARRLSMPGSDLKNVYTLRTIENSQAIRAASGNGKTALVMGGSFIGAEVAASLTQIGTKVIEIFPESRILERIVPEEVSNFLQSYYEKRGVRMLTGTVAERLDGNESVQKAVLNNGTELDVDLVVMGVGIQLNTELAQNAGLRVRESDLAVYVDEYLRTSDHRIYAAGDIAAWPDPTFEQRLRVEHWDVARGQGLQAGRNMAGENSIYTELPYFFSDLFEISFEVWGNLSTWDRTVLRGSLESGSFAVYYFATDRLVGVLAADRPDDERQPMQNLVKSRPEYDEIAPDLQNESVELAAIA